MNILVIDNEDNIRSGIVKMLQNAGTAVKSIREANGVESGIEAIKLYNPDLVFLDVEMDDGTGFDLLEKIGTPTFDVVFITAHDKYAVRAFRFSAIDFLLKPVERDELIAAVERAVNRKNTSEIGKQLLVLQESLGTIRSLDRKLVLKDSESIHFVNVNDIIHCEADGAYTRFYIVGSKPILISRLLKEYDEILTEFNFIRIHHSHLVNGKQIRRLDRANGGKLIMTNGDEVPVSQRRRDKLLDILGQI